MAIANTLPRTDLEATRGSWFGFVLACNLVGFLSALIANGNHAAYYRALELPSWAPPSQVFAPIWAVLYTLMGLATFLVWRDGTGEPRRAGLIAFGIQLGLNAIWTPIFFGLHATGVAFIVIVLNLAAIVMTGILYHRVRPLAGAMIVPLGAWVAFAATLNGAIWLMN